MSQSFPPAFSAAMRHYQATAAQYGDESPQAQQAWAKAIALAPPWFMDQMGQEFMQELNLVPDGYNEAGQALYSITQIAQRLGISDEQAHHNLSQLMQAKRETGQPLDGVLIGQPAHRRQ